MTDTIFALSSGSPPAAIAILRVSGPQAFRALGQLAGRLPPPRKAAVRTLRNAAGEVLDEALVLVFPGPQSATGEDCGELHCHGGRAVVAAVSTALACIPGLRVAEPGEFTRRAFANGRIDLAQTEALGDLLAAETELQRRVAQAGVSGQLSRQVEGWRREVLALGAMVEAALDFSDEDDVDPLPQEFFSRRERLRGEIYEALARPRAERLRDGVRVVLAGPPNSGKSSLFNALVDDGAAIVSPVAGTTRDAIERPVAFFGLPFVLVDTAGLRDEGAGEIEALGIQRAREHLGRADIVLWLGREGEGPEGAVEIETKSDQADAPRKNSPHHVVSSVTGSGLPELEADLAARARRILPGPSSVAINIRQAALLRDAVSGLEQSEIEDPLLIAESLRIARQAFDRMLGRSDIEDMLDALFARFCIGK